MKNSKKLESLKSKMFDAKQSGLVLGGGGQTPTTPADRATTSSSSTVAGVLIEDLDDSNGNVFSIKPVNRP